MTTIAPAISTLTPAWSVQYKPLTSQTIPAEGTQRRLQALAPQLHRTLDEILLEGSLLQGSRVEQLEREWKGYLGSPLQMSTVAVASGTAGLEVSLRAAGVGPGDLVACPGLTFVSSAFAILAVGAIPVFLDIEGTSYNLDPRQLAKACEQMDIKSVVAVHMYGNPADMTAIMAVARKHNLIVVEDASQAHGAAWEGRKVGTFGHMGIWSLYPGKNVGGLTDGGIIAINAVASNLDDDIASLTKLEHVARGLRDLGRNAGERYTHTAYGLRARMSELSAAVVSLQLTHLDVWVNQRRQLADVYSTHLWPTPLEIPLPSTSARHAYYKYAVLCKDADERNCLRAHLAAAHVETEVIYPSAVPDQLAFADNPGGYLIVGDLPEARDVASRIVALPCYPELSKTEALHVINTTRSFYGMQPAYEGTCREAQVVGSK